jgi:hypothetical protein
MVFPHVNVVTVIVSDQLLQGPHQDHPLPPPRRRHLHRRATPASDLQPRDDREVRLQRRALVQVELHLGEGGDHDERGKDQPGRAAASSPTPQSGHREAVIRREKKSSIPKLPFFCL